MTLGAVVNMATVNTIPVHEAEPEGARPGPTRPQSTRRGPTAVQRRHLSVRRLALLSGPRLTFGILPAGGGVDGRQSSDGRSAAVGGREVCGRAGGRSEVGTLEGGRRSVGWPAAGRRTMCSFYINYLHCLGMALKFKFKHFRLSAKYLIPCLLMMMMMMMLM